MKKLMEKAVFWSLWLLTLPLIGISHCILFLAYCCWYVTFNLMTVVLRLHGYKYPYYTENYKTFFKRIED